MYQTHAQRLPQKKIKQASGKTISKLLMKKSYGIAMLGGVVVVYAILHFFQLHDDHKTPLGFLIESVIFLGLVLYIFNILHEKLQQSVITKATESKKFAISAKRATMALSVVNEIDDRIMGCSDVISIFYHTCNRLAQCPNFNLVWVGMPDDGSDKKVNIVASAGAATGYIEGSYVGWGARSSGTNLTGMAIRSHKTQVMNSRLDTNWYNKVSAYGIRSTIAVPILVSGRVVAVMRVYSTKRNDFHKFELSMFNMLAKHLAYTFRSVDGISEIDRTVQERDKLQCKLENVLLGTISSLSRTLEHRDPYTAGHQQAVAKISVAIGKEMGLTEDRLNILHLGALIHDIGKIGVPADILTKPSKLTSAEYSIIQEHPKTGYEILESLEFEPIKRIVVEHHERLDGSGYPKGLTKDDILLESRIVSVADVIDSVTCHRPYRPALGIEKARQIIKKGNGHHFDPEVVKAFETLFQNGYSFTRDEETKPKDGRTLKYTSKA
ncbi:MAG: HD domain-containing protein [Magnetovibrio sp.]|nr:HD domain-containing protein [Magnetovibrio sp.]